MKISTTDSHEPLAFASPLAPCDGTPMGDEGLEPPKCRSTAELQSAPFAARVNHPLFFSKHACSPPGAAVSESIQQRQELRGIAGALRLVVVGGTKHDAQEIPAVWRRVKHMLDAYRSKISKCAV